MDLEKRLEKIERIIKILVDQLEAVAKKANVLFLVKPLIEALRKELNSEA